MADAGDAAQRPAPPKKPEFARHGVSRVSPSAPSPLAAAQHRRESR
jgi:hypothetical protein